jgi:hypothetical protein
MEWVSSFFVLLAEGVFCISGYKWMEITLASFNTCRGMLTCYDRVEGESIKIIISCEIL